MVLESGDHLLALTAAQETVVDKNALQLISDRAAQKQGQDARQLLGVQRRALDPRLSDHGPGIRNRRWGPLLESE